MPTDLSRIGPEPDCQYPGCQLLGRIRILSRPAGEHRIVCSLHHDWSGYRRSFSTEEAAEELGVPASLIRKWKHRGLVVPVGLLPGSGPSSTSPLYNLEELVPLANRWRTRQQKQV